MAKKRQDYGSFSLRQCWERRTRKPRARHSAVTGGTEGTGDYLKLLKEHFMANEGVLTERTKFAQMKQEPHESVTAWEGRVKEQGRRLEYSVNCDDQLLRDKFISGDQQREICQNHWIRVTKIKPTKEVSSFKTMLQIAKNFEQCEKEKAGIQQTKGPTMRTSKLYRSKESL